MHASNLLATITWYDNKPINLLSTVFSPIDMNDFVFVKRWHKTVEKSIHSSPILVHHQAHMRGVDVQNKDYKWWHRLFMRTLDTSLVNSSNMQEKGEKKIIP